MKVLFITPRFPFPPIGGDKLRAFAFLRYFSRFTDLRLVSFAEDSDELLYLPAARKMCSSVEVELLPKRLSYVNVLVGLSGGGPLQLSYYSSDRMRERITRAILGWRPELVFVHLIRMAEYVKDFDNPYKILDMTDSLGLSWRRSLRFRAGFVRAFHTIEAQRLDLYERRIGGYFDLCLLANRIDQEYLTRRNARGNFVIVPNGTELSPLPDVRPASPPRIGFIGNLRSFPNRDAVDFFIEKIFPKILRQRPGCQFWIIGANPKPEWSSPNIFVTGKVDDIRPYLQSCTVAVVPLRCGAGSHIKVFEAMICRVPVVATPIAIEGTALRGGIDCLISDRPEEFASQVVSLIDGGQKRADIIANAEATVRQNYTWQSSYRLLDQYISRLGSGPG
jgi:glycosyltransferase involved in cell wall biosynthesis